MQNYKKIMNYRHIENSLVPGTARDDAIQGTDTNGIIIYIPEGHWMWADYQAWLAEGNTPEAWNA